MDPRQKILDKVAQSMAELFDLERSKISAETTFEQLELTSIDAIDLVVQLQEMTGLKMTHSAMRNIRTVGDIVTFIHAHAGGGVRP